MGVALFLKGLVFLHDLSRLRHLLSVTHLFDNPWLAEPVAVIHIAGGILLAFGLWTRFAAAIQIPIVAGAALFVHLREGLFTDAQTLELDLLVLVILCLMALGGGGRYSIDAVFREPPPAELPTSRTA
jgi:uncharacterized membrane protein YphA (DoxX/SURF4 family)